MSRRCAGWLALLTVSVLAGTAQVGSAATASASAGTLADESAAQRLSDGSLLVPKAAQRRLQIRTRLAAPAEQTATLELNGRVIADPGAAGLVQAAQSGRIAAHDGGLPQLGKRVRKGEVLAWLEPVLPAVERAAQLAQLADLKAQVAAADRRVARFDQLTGVLPAREIEAARIDRDGLRARIAALSAGLDGREALVAPVSGVLAVSDVIVGQVVDVRQTLFEIVDPERLVVEALVYDAGLASRLGTATAMAGKTAIQLEFAGSGHALREGALPVRFRVRADAAALSAMAINQPVKVHARTTQAVRGVAVPAEAVVRNSAGDAIVWLHIEAERFAQQRVQVVPLDAGSVALTDGVSGKARVVVQGAALLSQIR